MLKHQLRVAALAFAALMFSEVEASAAPLPRIDAPHSSERSSVRFGHGGGFGHFGGGGFRHFGGFGFRRFGFATRPRLCRDGPTRWGLRLIQVDCCIATGCGNS